MIENSKTPQRPKERTAPAQVQVSSLQDMGKRFVSAWKHAEKGGPVNDEVHRA